MKKKKRLSGALIKSGFRSFDELIGGGFLPGYPWLLVADPEAEGTAVSAICMMSFNFAKRGYPTFIMPTRHPWGVSMEIYRRLIPEVCKKLEKAGEEGKLYAVNFSTPPKYKSTLKFEDCIGPTLMPRQIYEKLTKAMEGMKTGGKPIFWRLTSISDLTNLIHYYREQGLCDMIEPLLGWVQVNGAVGVATINRERVSEDLLNRMVSVFPNVIYVSAELGKVVKYRIQVTKSMNPKARLQKKELRMTHKYKVAIG